MCHERQRKGGKRREFGIQKIGLQPDILDGATIVKTYGDEYAIIENYKSIIEYTECSVKLQENMSR